MDKNKPSSSYAVGGDSKPPASNGDDKDGDHDGKIKNNAFHVDTNLIPQTSLDEQNSELRALGLSVFNQDEFEEGVMNQVDEAIAKEEQVRLHKILNKELNAINDDIKMAEKDLSRVDAAVTNIEDLDSMNRQTQRELESIRRQQANKIKQLKTLSVRKENVLKKIKEFEKGVFQQENDASGSTFDKAFQVKTTSQKETNKERMMRTGEMTPFGTVMKTESKPKQVKFTEYERFLSTGQAPGVKAKKDFKKYLKKKSLQAKVPNRDGAKSIHDEDLENGHSSRRGSRSADGTSDKACPVMHEDDKRLSDADDIYIFDDEDEYVPTKDEMQEGSSDEDGQYSSDYSGEEENLGALPKKQRRKKSTVKRRGPRPLPVYRENEEEEEPIRVKVKRDFSIRREKDDADHELYQDRLFKLQKLEAKEEKNKWTDGNEEDDSEAEFDGGLQVPQKLWKKLFSYQKTGVRWLWELHLQQAGGIVGDEMGLGKTIQTISFLAALRTSKVRNVNFPYKGLGPSIIICPTTIMHQWVKEFHKWWPEFRVAILHSSGSFSGSDTELVRSIAKSHGVLITSYNTLVIQQELVLRFNWHYVILDEGHKIRNPDAKMTLCCKQFRTPHRIILSGSPIQNNLKELWSLFDFVFPGKLGTLPDFMQHFSVPIVQGGYSNATQIQVETAYRCACVLRDTINPYLIRRMKADVKSNINLPNKNEQVLFCRITDEQRNVYEEYLSSRECNAILQGKFKVFAGLITLRKICNHPDLSTGGPQLFEGESPGDDPELTYGYWRRSGKMIVVEALLRLWKKQDRRVLLFTQSKSMMNVLEKFVQDQGYSYLTMDGSTSIGTRQPLVTQYNSDPSIYLFLLTTRVGGLGINLTGADRVIIYDPDWNPSTDMQARERAWRIGQKKQVTIYRLLTSGTIEEKIYHRQIFKQFLTNRILKDPKQRRLFQSQHLFDLFTLGSKDNKEGTETSALFAGTGCDVRVPAKRKSVNRFDEMKRKREEVEMKNAKRRREVHWSDDEGRKDEDEHEIDSSEVKRMKEFARRLSRKMEEEKSKKTLCDDSIDKDKISEDKEVSNNEESDENIHCEPSTDSMKTNYATESVKVEEDGEVTDTTSQIQIAGTSQSSLSFIEEVKVKKESKKWKIPLRKTKTVHTDDGSTPEKETIDKAPPIKHRKKKHRDARFEGEKIPHLVKHCTSKQTQDNGSNPEEIQQQKQEHKQQDDYVLRELFKKTGIDGAMKHDKIVDSSRPDYAIVEAEAERVAKEAAMALKHSRRQCSSAMLGEPSWTGHNGTLSSKPRFGQKKNSLLLNKTDKNPEAAANSSTSVSTTSNEKPSVSKSDSRETLFDGSISGNSALNSKNNSLSSNDLLSRIHSRKRLSSATMVDADDDDEFLRPDVQQNLNPNDEELLGDIRNYVSFMASTDGQASTEEIVLNFGKRLPKSDAPKFKAMLKQICDLNQGIWRLKPEFR